MNNRGQTLMLSVVFAVILFFAGALFLNFLPSEVTTARSASALDCQNSTISDGTKLTCLVVDTTIPYWILLILSSAGGFIISRYMI
jgi:hypothetical protein